jgi:hypothetical protein
MDRGYAGLGYASVSRLTASVAVFCAIGSILQVILVIVKELLVDGELLVEGELLVAGKLLVTDFGGEGK